MIIEDAAKELRGWLETADQVLLTTPVNYRAISAQETKESALEDSSRVTASSKSSPPRSRSLAPSPVPADLSVLTKIVESVIAKKPAPPATELGSDCGPLSRPHRPFFLLAPGQSCRLTTTPPANLLTADAEKALGSFLKEAHDELLNIEVDEKKLTRDERKQQLLKYFDDDGFLAEFRQAVGKSDATILPLTGMRRKDH